jgi:hypothetical protein
MLDEITRLAKQYKFFHWHLEFPDVFTAAASPPQGGPASMPPAAERGAANEQMGWTGGFDCILGNPVWERVKLQEQEFFATRAPEIANAANAAARKKLIAALPTTNPTLWTEWCDALRESQGASQFMRESGRYPHCGVGDINTFAVFSELNRAVLAPPGRAAFIVPAGIATDDTTKAFFDDLVKKSLLAAVYHFENEDRLFADVHHSFRFVIVGLGPSKAADLLFFARQTSALADKSRHFTLTPDDFRLLNPNTRTCPTFRSIADAELNKYIYRRIGVLWDETKPDGNPWGLSFMAMFHMANDSGLFRTRTEMEAAGQTLTGNTWDGPLGKFLPLIEAKMVNHFDHRFSTYEGATQAQLNVGALPRLDAAAHADPYRFTQPDYWVAQENINGRLAGKANRKWLLGWRDITNNTNQRTVISAIIPAAGVGDKFLLAFPDQSPTVIAGVAATLNSFALDYCARQKIGCTSLKYYLIRQLPILAPAALTVRCPWAADATVIEWLLPRVLELTYTSWDLEPFAKDCGYEGPPFVWDEERRFQLRAELDAAFFHLYLGTPDEWNRSASDGLKSHLPTPRDAVSHILETFPIVKKKDLESFGNFRTKDTILSIYDALPAAITASTHPRPRLSQPPCDASRRHSPTAS